MADEKKLPQELRDLLAEREEAAAKLNLAEAEVAKQKAEFSRLRAELFRNDVESMLSIREVVRW